MQHPRGLRAVGFGLVVVALAFPCRALAQIDLSGEWAARLHEDQPHRFEGPSIGDYTGLPLNDAARLKADSWDASIQSLREHQLQPLTAIYGSHGIANLRISKIVDDASQEVVAYKIFRSPGTGGIRMFWMDGRSHPDEYAAHTWQGFSTGTWTGGMLTVKTTHLKAGVIQRDGVPHSDRAELTEHFVRHGDYLTVIGVIDDPAYLDEPLVRSWNYVLDLGQQLESVPGQIVDEIAGLVPGRVPHHLPGTNPFLKEFAEHVGLPFEAVRGGRETTYPEYQTKLRALLDKMPKKPAP
jgi:hypothetical protein